MLGIIIIGISLLFSGTSYDANVNYIFPGLGATGVLILVVGMVLDIVFQEWDVRTKLVLLVILLVGTATYIAGMFIVIGNRIAIVTDMKTFGYQFQSPAALDTSSINAQFSVLIIGSCLLVAASSAYIAKRLPEVTLILVIVLATFVIGVLIVDNGLGNAFQNFSDYPGSGGEDFHNFHVLNWCESRLGGILLLMITPLVVAGASFIEISRRSVPNRPPEEHAGINTQGRLLTLAFFTSSTLANFALGIISATGSYSNPGFVLPIIPEIGIVILFVIFRSYFIRGKPWSLARKGIVILIFLFLGISLGAQIIPQNNALGNGYVLTVSIDRGITGPAPVPTVVISAILSDIMLVIWICIWFAIFVKSELIWEKQLRARKNR